MEVGGHRVLFKARVGSHSYGTNVEGSDEDFKGVFIQDPRDVLENGYVPQLDINKDEVYYELGRFVELLCTANPTMLELLYSPSDCIIYGDSLIGALWIERDKFLTKQCRHSFAGYAYSQISKAGGLDKKMNWEKDKVVRKSIEDFCWVYSFDHTPHYITSAFTLKGYLDMNGYAPGDCGLVKVDHMRDCYLLFCDDLSWIQRTGDRFKENVKTHSFKGICTEASNDVCLSEVPAYITPRGVLYFNKDAYSIHCREYNEYESWLKHRNAQRYVDVEGHGQQIDGKNLLHCVRLVETGLDIALSGTLVVRRPNASYLIEIRKGKHDLKSLMTKCENDLKILDAKFNESTLPEKVDEVLMKDIVKSIRREYYRQTNASKTSNP